MFLLRLSYSRYFCGWSVGPAGPALSSAEKKTTYDITSHDFTS